MHINEIRKELTRIEFTKRLKGGVDECSLYYQNECISCPKTIGLKDYESIESLCNDENSCLNCWMNAIENIKFKDELEENEFNNAELTEDETKIVANKVQEEYLLKEIQELKDIKTQYECQINELTAKIQYLESLQSPICDCMIDPESERKHYKSIVDENVRLKNIIKLMADSL